MSSLQCAGYRVILCGHCFDDLDESVDVSTFEAATELAASLTSQGWEVVVLPIALIID